MCRRPLSCRQSTGFHSCRATIPRKAYSLLHRLTPVPHLAPSGRWPQPCREVDFGTPLVVDSFAPPGSLTPPGPRSKTGPIPPGFFGAMPQPMAVSNHSDPSWFVVSNWSGPPHLSPAAESCYGSGFSRSQRGAQGAVGWGMGDGLGVAGGIAWETSHDSAGVIRVGDLIPEGSIKAIRLYGYNPSGMKSA